MSIKLCSPLIMMTRGAKVMSIVWGKGNGLGIQFKDGKGVRRIQSCGDCYD
jgi:hypothetical protein